MSMNLHAKYNNNEIDLIQTPTWVTKLCLYKYDGTKRKWKDTRHLYCQWVLGTFLTNRVLKNEKEVEEYNEDKKYYKDHINTLNSYEKLKFYEL